jgi:hypothetical protein
MFQVSIKKFMKIVSDIKYACIVMFLMLCLGFHVNRKFQQNEFLYSQLLHLVVLILLSKLLVSTDEVNTESKDC